ncbi:capsular polysaccharide biosynthesis protein [Ochrobactrum sp. SD129]|nr:capsular polysaccharide biosynthesis protein [Ochrobactrum sp. SD129]
MSNIYGNSGSNSALLHSFDRLHVSAAIQQQRQLCRIIEHQGFNITRSQKAATAFAGWGRKNSGIKAQNLALRYDKPAFALEDGFLRSVGLGQKGEPPLSIIMDSIGIYYDATTPSWLETRLNKVEMANGYDASYVREQISSLREKRLSKYNNIGRDTYDSSLGGGYVLVIDQTKDDPSISFGLAQSTTFVQMLAAARDENSGKRILVKTHPSVLAGVAQGHFDPRDSSIEFIVNPVNTWLLLEGAEKVYTVSSGMGMEALLAGKKVRCFGMPFYAGWGLTDDQLTNERRTSKLTLENLFSAAYLEYPIYYDPYLDEITSFDKALDILSFLRDQNESNRRKTVCVGMSKWKRPSVKAFLGSTHQQPVFMGSHEEAIQKASRENARLVIWASKATQAFEEKCANSSVHLLKMEDGFLRSKGLGSDLIPPLSLVLDEMGIYYDPGKASDLESLIQTGEFAPGVIETAQIIKNQILQSGLTKYNVGQQAFIENLPQDGQTKIVLVPGQVADDASIRKGTFGSEVTTNMELLQAARRANPDAFIIYKPHPDVEAGNRIGRLPPHLALNFADYIATDISTNHVLKLCHEVWTLTSLLGFEALLRGKNVVCCGLPFYAGWGLTTDHVICQRRTRRATLDEVFAAAYVLYSKYIFHGLDGYMRMPAHLAPAVLSQKT